jgi:hypothetical protein
MAPELEEPLATSIKRRKNAETIAELWEERSFLLTVDLNRNKGLAEQQTTEISELKEKLRTASS